MLVEFVTAPYTSASSTEPVPGCRCAINPEYVASVYELTDKRFDRKTCTITMGATMDEGTSEYHIVRGSFEEVMEKLDAESK
jgi:hypothetical protein